MPSGCNSRLALSLLIGRVVCDSCCAMLGSCYWASFVTGVATVCWGNALSYDWFRPLCYLSMESGPILFLSAHTQEHAFNGLGYDTRNGYGTGAMQNGLAQASIAVCFPFICHILVFLGFPNCYRTWPICLIPAIQCVTVLVRCNAMPCHAQLRDHFFWVSHTWSHIDMYCPDSDCEKNGAYPSGFGLWWDVCSHWPAILPLRL
jgi:hypothetical protein